MMGFDVQSDVFVYIGDECGDEFIGVQSDVDIEIMVV